MQFSYAPELFTQYPDLTGGILSGTAASNGPTPPALLAAYRAEQVSVASRIRTPLSEIESLAAWRQALRTFGVNPTKYRTAAEALLRRLTKKGDIPSINMLVDIGNLVSIRYMLPVAIFDTRAVSAPVTVCSARGDEYFQELGRTQVIHPEPGEIIFVDAQKKVIARRWCWRQSAESAARVDTTRILATIESQHPGARREVEAALDDLYMLLMQYAGGVYSRGLLNVDRPGFASAGV